MKKLLEKINSPNDLKKLKTSSLKQICDELRQFIIDNAAINGGHFGSSLGVVELTVALHYIYNTPYDRIVWDVGHQAYGHKILTGRRKNFHTNRKKGGLCGFTKRGESKYDAFVAGHASVSISAALGMATASYLKKEDRKHIAVIGDGSLTGGLAFEGLNNAGVSGADLLVILNDNQISIDPNVGALKNYLVDITTSSGFNNLRQSVKEALKKSGTVGKGIDKFAARIEKSLKQFILKDSNFFEALNFRYFGPVDGHDVVHLTKVLADLRKVEGPKILHVLTKKGKGFEPAEIDQVKWHATGGFNQEELSNDDCRMLNEKEEKNTTHSSLTTPHSPLKYQEIFGHTMVELAEKDKKIVGITPAMPSGSSLDIMMKAMPDRAFDVGICEQHAVTFSAGLACEDLTPFCNIYSTFAQRAYDQIIHDVAIEKVPVVFCLDRGGLVGEDGETHQGAFDLAYLRPIPNLIIAVPMNEVELRHLMYTASKYKDGPFVIRYPRGKGVITDWKQLMEKIEIGKGRMISEGDGDVAILSVGPVGNVVQKVVRNKSAKDQRLETKDLISHYDMRFIKPLDKVLLEKIFKKYKTIITIEEGVKKGGFGSAVLEWANENGYKNPIKIIGLPDKFIAHATVEEQRAECGIDEAGIMDILENLS